MFFLNKNNSGTRYITSINTDEITDIRISKDSNNDIIFKKNKNAIWHMTEPYNLKAHQFRIKTLLSLTKTPIDNSYNTDSLTLSSYALAPPRARITFNQTEISFGKTSPVNNKRYLMTNNKMFLAYEKIYPLVNAQASSFIDLSLLPDNFNITKIQTPSSAIFLNKNNTWESSSKNQLDADQIQLFLQHWKSAQAFAVHKYTNRKQLGKIEISSNTRTLVFEIADDDPWLILALPEINIEYHLDKSLKDTLSGILTSDPPNA